MGSHPLEEYIREVRNLHKSGAATPELSYYSALKTLLDAVGKKLKPKVACIVNPASIGAGIPDIGLYSEDQFPSANSSTPPVNTPPARGAVEAKPTWDDSWITADGEQVTKYWGKYSTVLVTNFRDFVLVAKDSSGACAKLDRYRLAATAAEFWAEANHPERMTEIHGSELLDFLRRVLLHNAELFDPKDVASFLAQYARSARALIGSKDLSPLTNLRDTLSDVLGLDFENEAGGEFFRSTLVQGLFYGIFSAWVFWARKTSDKSKEKFDWKAAQHELHVPAVRKLLHELTDPGQLKELGLPEVLDWTGAMLNRVDRTSFFQSFAEQEAVQHFYEPFLKAYDPGLRKMLGVWYTPREIVRYMVERVDQVLRTELGVPDGLAADNVLVLDPCCGTGAYLVETLRKIAETEKAKGNAGIAGLRAKKAAIERIFGFEILPSPFVVAHLQVGIALQELGAPLADDNERAAIYLTNALTGWEPPKGTKKQLKLVFPEFLQEQKSATKVKQERPILVVLGNPPYNAFAGVSTEEEGHLVEAYKEGLISEWKIKKFNLDELYVRFFRLAEKRIAEKTGKGIVAYISNASWMDDPSFVVLRKHLLKSFNKFWIEDLHGNRKISEYAPDGHTSETIFAIPGFSPGIQQAVSTSLWVKYGDWSNKTRVLFRDDHNAAKASERRAQLLNSLSEDDFDAKYVESSPTAENRFSFRPLRVAKRYLEWPRVNELCAEPPSYGLMEKRGGALIDSSRSELATRMHAYLNPKFTWEEYRDTGYGMTSDQARFNAKSTREKVIAAETFNEERLVRYVVRPFDVRWAYYTPVRPVWNEPRPELWPQIWQGNKFIVTRFRTSDPNEGAPFFFATSLIDDHLLTPDAVAIPVWLKAPEEGANPLGNISTNVETYFAQISGQTEPSRKVSQLIYARSRDRLCSEISIGKRRRSEGGLAEDSNASVERTPDEIFCLRTKGSSPTGHAL